MIIIQLDSDQLSNLIKTSIRAVLAEQSAPDQAENDPFLSIKEAAAFLNLATQTVYGFTSNGTIPFIKKGKKLYFKKSELTKWINEGKRG
jgi:excisionase family DNA binding protein